MKIFAFALFGVTALFAGEPVKVNRIIVGGKEYTDATISEESRLTAKIMHAAGVARVAMADIPEDVRSKLSTPEKILQSLPEETISVRTLDPKGKEFAAIFADVLESERIGLFYRDVTVIQTISEVMKLAKFGENADSIMLIGDTKERADGSMFSAYVKETGRFQSYVTVLGASKKVAVYQLIPQMSEDNFIASLKAGAGYKIQHGYGFVVCPACNGSLVACVSCENTGRIPKKKTLHVEW